MDGEDPLVAQCRGRIGRLISGKWRLDALIGVGGMAAVYMATHRNGSLSAVKILHNEIAAHQEVRERFLREAYIANKVDHPGTVKVMDDDHDEHGAPYIVMELLRGETIDARAQKQGGRLPILDTIDIVDQTLAVLEAAHAQTIVHRDLKPENLFMTDQRQLKVLDFGIARLHEEKHAKRTQTGLVMGTPAFMAPEQAMGRWNEVDARTDLWAVGATAFTLLTGLPVHEAETAGEMLIAAATRPARSLARVLHQAPFPLVAVIDRSLAYEQTNRFADAQSFRAELAKVRAALQAEATPQAQAPGNARAQPLIPATVHGQEALAGLPANPFDLVDDDDDNARVEGYDPSSNSDEEIAHMTRFFALLERALSASKQYHRDHPEPKRRFDDAFRELASALMTCEVALAWNLTPYSFGCRDQLMWEPEAPWNRVPYQLFADGVRMMGFAPGLDETEFQRWVRIITLDPVVDFAPEDDMVTLLWDEDLQHVFFQAIDSFAEGNQDQRARYEAERAHVVAGAHGDHRKQLAQVMHEERKNPKRADPERGNAVEKSRELMRLLSRGDANDTETAARVANLNILEESPEEAAAANSIRLDDTTRALLAARLEVDVAGTSERFVIAAADAFVVSAKLGRSTAVTTPLKRAIDGLGTTAPAKAVEMILELRDAVVVDNKELETETLRETMTSEVLSAGTLLEILKGGDKLGPDVKPEYMKGVARVLGCLQPQHFDSALAYLASAPAGELQQLLLGYLKRTGQGHEAKIATLFARADVDLGLALVRLLAELGSEASKEAISSASQSPHALVRIEALGHIEGTSGSRLRIEMRKLLEDTDPDVRLLALRAMESHSIAIAGPFLVLRIQEAQFFQLPFEERRQALQTLSVLRSKRCEELCMTLLGQSQLWPNTARDETRELAAQFLADVASSNAALFLLEGIANSTAWRNRRRVRDAATAALVRLKTRAEEAERRRSERKSEVSPPSDQTAAKSTVAKKVAAATAEKTNKTQLSSRRVAAGPASGAQANDNATRTVSQDPPAAKDRRPKPSKPSMPGVSGVSGSEPPPTGNAKAARGRP